MTPHTSSVDRTQLPHPSCGAHRMLPKHQEGPTRWGVLTPTVVLPFQLTPITHMAVPCTNPVQWEYTLEGPPSLLKSTWGERGCLSRFHRLNLWWYGFILPSPPTKILIFLVQRDWKAVSPQWFSPLSIYLFSQCQLPTQRGTASDDRAPLNPD